jgi:hypothetical protein
MAMKLWTMLLTFLLLPAAALGQETVRSLEGSGPNTKYLTPGQLDSWLFQGEKGETIIAHVATREFDSILELAARGDPEDKVLLEVDDEGSDSQFMVRLPQTGDYRLRVHAFKFQGGGNYVLEVRRFQAQPLEVGRPVLGTFDHEGKSYLHFHGSKDQILIPDLKGAAAGSWKMLDFKGREMNDWAGTVRLEEDGEHALVLSGPPNQRYDLLVREARHRTLAEGRDLSGRLGQGEMEVWDLAGHPGDFRLLEVEKQGELASRLVYAPTEKRKEPRLASAADLPEIQFLPVASRGGRVRFAVFLGRTGRYQLQLLARTAASYHLKVADPTVLLERGQEVRGSLPVAGSAFYSFQAVPGQLVEARLGSEQFVPLLRLYDGRGQLVRMNDGADGLESRLTFMVQKAGLYRLQVSSAGDGGGGDFRLGLQDGKVNELAVGGRGRGTLKPGGTDFWAFEGKEGQTVILSVRSSACEPVVSLYSPDGVRLAGDENRAAGTDSLQAVQLPRSGRYTVWITSRRGAGDYTLRLLDGD